LLQLFHSCCALCFTRSRPTGNPDFLGVKLCDKFHKEISEVKSLLQVLFGFRPRKPLRYRRRVTGNPALIEEIRREAARNGGRITFERFMELALYHPQHGYYTSGKARLGKSGDFFTSVSVGPLFGRILARQFQQWGVDEVVEFGGHRGQLRQDVLAAAPELRYRVAEVGDELPEKITGCVFSNEFLDALPVHRVCGDREVYVTGDFEETLGPMSDNRLPRLPEGYRSEFNLRALDWLEDVARRLQRGYVLTIDYGFEREEYFAPHHKDGHLQCYYRHTKSGNPYEHIGEQDITAHVEFTSLIEHGKKLGLEPVLFTTQERYLMKIGEAEILQTPDRKPAHQLLHSTMGRAFKVLIQRKS
jgi:SAM-dependent MidA family methyltransferase